MNLLHFNAHSYLNHTHTHSLISAGRVRRSCAWTYGVSIDDLITRSDNYHSSMIFLLQNSCFIQRSLIVPRLMQCQWKPHREDEGNNMMWARARERERESEEERKQKHRTKNLMAKIRHKTALPFTSSATHKIKFNAIEDIKMTRSDDDVTVMRR